MEPRHPRGKLRNKIFLLMLLVSVVPILISAFLSVYSITVSHRLDIANLESAVLDLKTKEIENVMNMDIAAAFKIMVPSDTTEDLDPQLKSLALKTMFNRVQWTQELAAVALGGRETMKFDRARPDGVPGSELRDVSGDEGFLYAKKTGQIYISAVSSTPEGPMVNVAASITNKNGAVLSVVTGKFLLNGPKGFVEEAGLGNTGYVYLVANSGVLIGGGAAGPTPESNFKNIGIVESVLAGTDFLGPDGQRRYNNFLGEEVVAAGKYIPDYKWGLVAEWPTREADANINSLINKDIIVSLVVLAAVIIVSIVLAILIVRPVRKLEKGTELVARGKFDEKVDIKSGDELEELGQAFNKMMAGLKQLEELKDEFVFIAAHELRTPVAAMKGYLTLILDGVAGPITEKTKEFVNKVINSNQRLIQLVNDLLEVSRSEAGRLTIKVSPVNMSEPIDAALNELKLLADQKAMEIRYEIPENLPKVFADPDRVKEVMVNLVGNAVKYSDPKGIVVVSHEIHPHTNCSKIFAYAPSEGEDALRLKSSISTGFAPIGVGAQGDYLVTHVKDSGFGISKEAQAKLFEKFYRIQTGKSKEITGTGLGLFIVKEIIEKMNGKIWAESEGEGKGSTFSFSLPIAG